MVTGLSKPNSKTAKLCPDKYDEKAKEDTNEQENNGIDH